MEQDRITRELADAGAVLASTDVHWDTVETNLKLALGLISRLGEAYRESTPSERRWYNQAVFKRVAVDTGGRLVKVKLAEPFKTLTDHDLPERLAEEMKNRRPSWDGGSTTTGLVEAMGLEPTNLLTASQALYQLSYAPVAPDRAHLGPGQDLTADCESPEECDRRHQ